jgi:hypothetical protein
MKPGRVFLVTSQMLPDGSQRWFHQGWCNYQSYVNETLQTLQIVLVSDPFSKDSEHTAQPSFCLRSRCKFQASQPDRLSAVM